MIMPATSAREAGRTGLRSRSARRNEESAMPACGDKSPATPFPRCAASYTREKWSNAGIKAGQ